MTGSLQPKGKDRWRPCVGCGGVIEPGDPDCVVDRYDETVVAHSASCLAEFYAIHHRADLDQDG